MTMRSIGDDPVLQLTITSKNSPRMVGVDFLPVLDSPSADVHASIVFVGYGISDPAQGIDDYAGVDVRNKIVLFLRGKPDRYTGSATPSDKERIAKEKGALAYLTATGPALSAYEARRGISGKPSAFYSGTPSAHQLPGAWISTPTAEAILRQGSPDSADLRMLQEEANRGQARPVVTDVTADLKWESRASTGHLFNIAWVLRGSSPAADEAVVIGAHRDHFGRQAGLLFAGADDNASGTAVLLEVARVLADTAAAPMRSILFVSFSGEEQGLLGSRLYIAEPIIPLHKTIAMINVDHAGIGNGRLTVGLTGIEKALALKTGQAAGLEDQVDIFGFFPGGDHVPFKEAGVPTVTVVSAGIHPHFHQATDTADTLDPEILRRTARYVLTMAWQLANAPVSIGKIIENRAKEFRRGASTELTAREQSVAEDPARPPEIRLDWHLESDQSKAVAPTSSPRRSKPDRWWDCENCTTQSSAPAYRDSLASPGCRDTNYPVPPTRTTVPPRHRMSGRRLRSAPRPHRSLLSPLPRR